MELLVLAIVALVAAGIVHRLWRSARTAKHRGQRSTSPESWTPAHRLWWPEVEDPVPRDDLRARITLDLPDETPSG